MLKIQFFCFLFIIWFIISTINEIYFPQNLTFGYGITRESFSDILGSTCNISEGSSVFLRSNHLEEEHSSNVIYVKGHLCNYVKHLWKLCKTKTRSKGERQIHNRMHVILNWIFRTLATSG